MKEELRRYFLNLDVYNLGYVDNEDKRTTNRIHGKDVSFARKLLMNGIDIDHDGHITLEELISAFEKKPFTDIAPEHDFCGMVAGELVALIYEDLGLLVKRNGLEKSYDARSFGKSGHLVLLKRAHLGNMVGLRFKDDGDDDSGNEDELEQLEDDSYGLDEYAGEELILMT